MTLINPFRRQSDELVPPKTAVVERTTIDPRMLPLFEKFAELSSERDEADKDRNRLRADYAHLKEQYDHAVELGSKAARHITELQEELTNFKSRNAIYQLERDEAVTKCANATAELNNVMKQLKAIVGHHPEPIAPDAKNSVPALDYKVPPVNLGTTANTSAPRPPSMDEMVARINGK